MSRQNPIPNFLQNLRGYMRQWPARMSQRALNEMKTNFARQGYDGDAGFKPWKPRKKAEKGARRALLIKSGRLRRSLRANPLPLMPRVTTDVPYAEALNDGFRGVQNVRPHKRTATQKRTVKGSFSGTAVKQKKATVTLQGARHNVRGFSRKVNIEARPFLTVGKNFLDQEEKRFLDDLETMFLQSK